MREWAKASKEKLAKKEEEKLSSSKWISSSVFALKFLCAANKWSTAGVPTLPKFTVQLLESKLTGAIMLVRNRARLERWPGCILRAGLNDILVKGLISDDINRAPSGFTALYCYPCGYYEIDGEEFDLQQARELWGDGEMPEPLLKAFTKKKVFVPDNTHQAVDMLNVTISFLECITAKDSIAAGGYKTGLNLIGEHRSLFEMAASNDRLFLTKFLCFLDRFFQRFCQMIERFEDEVDPVFSFVASHGEDWMQAEICNIVVPWTDSGILPAFQLPLALQGKKVENGLMELSGGRAGEKPIGAKISKGSGEPSAGGGKKKGGDSGSKGGSPLSPSEFVPEWQPPPGKKMGDYFGGRNFDKNISGIPKVQHHKLDKLAHICLRHQIDDGVPCRQGARCHLAHVKPKDLDPAIFEAMTQHMKKVYGEKGN